MKSPYLQELTLLNILEKTAPSKKTYLRNDKCL